MQPMLDPERDLKGATPETLARALLRRTVGGAGSLVSRVICQARTLSGRAPDGSPLAAMRSR